MLEGGVEPPGAGRSRRHCRRDLHDRLPAAPSVARRAPNADAVAVKAKVTVTEITGSESFVHLDFADARWVMLAHGIHDLRAGRDDRGLHRSAPHHGLRRERQLRRAAARSWRLRRRAWRASISTISATPTGPTRSRTTDYALKEVHHSLRGRRRLCAARAVGLRQDHAAEHHFRPAAPLARPAAVRRRGRDRPVDAGAQHRAGVPVPGHLRHHDRLRQSGLSAAQPRRAGSRRRPQGARDARDDRPRRLGQAEGARPDRRPEAEDLARPRPGALRRQRHPVRRAADGHRSAYEMGAALAAEAAAPALRLHHGLCHARPDRGADLRRQGRRHV